MQIHYKRQLSKRICFQVLDRIIGKDWKGPQDRYSMELILNYNSEEYQKRIPKPMHYWNKHHFGYYMNWKEEENQIIQSLGSHPSLNGAIAWISAHEEKIIARYN